jgi:hypothetical protein
VAGSETEWVTLNEASSRLTAQYGISGFEAVRRAVHSGEVPVRGLPLDHQISSIPARIEKEIEFAVTIEIDHCSVIRDQFGGYFGGMSKLNGANALHTAKPICSPLRGTPRSIDERQIPRSTKKLKRNTTTLRPSSENRQI